MSEFQTYFTLGYQHILDWQGYDHMVFILALIAPIALKEWKKILILITAFTLGHSVALALSTLNIVSINPFWIELFIPITILITAIVNVTIHQQLKNINYVIVVMFGLVHGTGFSGYLKSLLGLEQSLFVPLLSFNLGLEFGQILFTLFLMFIVIISNKFLPIKHRTVNLAFSGLAGLVSIFLILERI